jgi:hypothetical protein
MDAYKKVGRMSMFLTFDIGLPFMAMVGRIELSYEKVEVRIWGRIFSLLSPVMKS